VNWEALTAKWLEELRELRSTTDGALTSNVATITLSAAHTMLPGEVVTVVCSNTALNGAFVIKSISNINKHRPKRGARGFQ
jgi:hypothetical protein